MGMYDTVIVKCPKCGKDHEFQSKGGVCNLNIYALHNAPEDVMSDINRHSPYKCDCGASISVIQILRQYVAIRSK